MQRGIVCPCMICLRITDIYICVCFRLTKFCWNAKKTSRETHAHAVLRRMTNRQTRPVFRLLGVATLEKSDGITAEGGAISFLRHFPTLHRRRMRTSLDVGVAHVEEHAVDVSHVAPVLVGELVVAGKQEERSMKVTLQEIIKARLRECRIYPPAAGDSRNLWQAFLFICIYLHKSILRNPWFKTTRKRNNCKLTCRRRTRRRSSPGWSRTRRCRACPREPRCARTTTQTRSTWATAMCKFKFPSKVNWDFVRYRRVSHLFRYQGWVDFHFGCSTISRRTLLGELGTCQRWLCSSQTRFDV